MNSHTDDCHEKDVEADREAGENAKTRDLRCFFYARDKVEEEADPDEEEGREHFAEAMQR